MPRALYRRRLTAILLAGLLILAACGNDDTDTPDAASSPATSGEDLHPADETAPEPGDDDGPDGEEGSAALLGTGACDLLDPEYLADTVSFEFGDSVWEEQPDADPNRCRWFNESKLLTLSVAIDTPEGSAIEDRRTNPPSTGGNEDLDAIPGAFAVRDEFGDRYYQAWMPVDGVVVSLIADVMQIEDEQFVTVAGEVYRRAAG